MRVAAVNLGWRLAVNEAADTDSSAPSFCSSFFPPLDSAVTSAWKPSNPTCTPSAFFCAIVSFDTSSCNRNSLILLDLSSPLCAPLLLVLSSCGCVAVLSSAVCCRNLNDRERCLTSKQPSSSRKTHNTFHYSTHLFLLTPFTQHTNHNHTTYPTHTLAPPTYPPTTHCCPSAIVTSTSTAGSILICVSDRTTSGLACRSMSRL